MFWSQTDTDCVNRISCMWVLAGTKKNLFRTLCTVEIVLRGRATTHITILQTPPQLLGLHWQPLDAAIARVSAPWCPSSHHVHWFHCKTQNTKKRHLLASKLTVQSTSKISDFHTPKRTLYLGHYCDDNRSETTWLELKCSATFPAIKHWSYDKKWKRYLASTKLVKKVGARKHQQT